MEDNNRTTKHREDIQGLRALAVLLVVVYHSGLSVIPGGYIGVDIFFVISGYLIAGMLFREINLNGNIDLLSFYARRARRLIPAASLVLLATCIYSSVIYSPLELKQFSSSAIATAVYLSNFWFAHLATDYLSNHANPNPLLHTWSLSVEEQFYLFWPVMLILFHRVGAALKSTQTVMVGVVVLSVFSLALCIFLTNYSQPWAFFVFVTRGWEFGAGAITAAFVARSFKPSPLTSKILCGVGIGLISGSAFLFDDRTNFPGYAAIIPVLSTCILLGLCSPGSTPTIYRCFSNRISILIGDISYSLYLWHWPVFVFLNYHLQDQAIFIALVGTTLSIALALLTYVFLENPIRFNQKIAKSNFRTYAVTSIFLLFGLCFSIFIREQSKSGLATEFQQFVMSTSEKLPAHYNDDCHISQLETDPKICRYGAKDTRKTIALFGDSHAAHWFPAFLEIAQRGKFELIPLTKSSCPSIEFEPINPNFSRPYSECTAWRNNVIKFLREIKPTYIVLGNSHGYRQVDNLTEQQWATAINKVIAKLPIPDSKVVLISDVPRLHVDGPTCLARADWHNRDHTRVCSVKPAVMQDHGYLRSERSLASKHLRVLDMTSEICAQDSCPIYRDGVILYSDRHHLSVEYSRSLADEIAGKLDIPLPQDTVTSQ